jgi:hypothetical protein
LQSRTLPRKFPGSILGTRSCYQEDQARFPFLYPGPAATLCRDYYQGNGGRGTGSGPLRRTGDPLAIITALVSECAATMVFRPIAPANTSMARKRGASLRDIVPPRTIKRTEALYPLLRKCQVGSRLEPVPIGTHQTVPRLRQVFAWRVVEGLVRPRVSYGWGEERSTVQ